MFGFFMVLLLQNMAESEMVVAITLICLGVFYVLERLFNLTTICFAWYYGDNVNNGGISEPGEEIQVLKQL
jgi:hypothetical protein